MVMNFYRQQELARRQEKIMLLLFFVASVLLTMLITQAISFGVRLFLNAQNQSSPFVWWFAVAFFASIVMVSVHKVMELSSTNYAVIMTSSVPLNKVKNMDTLKKEQLRNVIEEMAISAGILVPKIYVLDNEPNVNAFSTGLRSADMVVSFTRGCLEKLDRDELQGISAYQIAQIINGQARLNTLVYGVLYGLQFVYSNLAKLFIVENAQGKQEIMDIRIIIAIFPLWLVTYTGHFFAQMIKSIICRENVFESDGTAVQLTRNPEGIASVLWKSLDFEYTRLIFAKTFLQDLEHLLFTFGKNPVYEFKMLHTHPDTKKRIRNILPRWRENRLPKNKTSCQNNTGPTNFAPNLNAAVLGVAGSLMQHAAPPICDEDYWFQAARDTEKSPIIPVAMLVQHHQNPKVCLEIVETFRPAWKESIHELLNHPMPNERLFALLATALPSVRLQIIGEANVKSYQTFLQDIIKADQQITLFEHCVYAAVSGSLATSITIEFLPAIAKQKLQKEISELLMLTAKYSSNNHQAEQAFQAACKYCDVPISSYQDTIALSQLSPLLYRLNRLSLSDKQELLSAMHVIVDFDQQRTNDEKNWIDAMSIALL